MTKHDERNHGRDQDKDNPRGQGTGSVSGTTFKWADTVANLRLLPAGKAGDVVILGGYWNAGDGGGGVFWWENSPRADDNGTIINSVGFGVSSAGWRRIYAGALNVKWFGASGNGTTNDGPSVRCALNVVLASINGALYLPAGKYWLDEDGATGAALNVTVPPGGNIAILGDGPDSILLAPSNAAKHVLALLANTQNDQSIRLATLQIQGSAVDEPNGGGFGIFTSAGVNNVTIEDLTFSGPTETTGLSNGVKNDTGSNWIIKHCLFQRLIGNPLGGGRGYGVLLGNASRVLVEGCVFIGNMNTTPKQGRHAVYISSGTQHAVVSANVVTDFNESAFPMNASTGQSANAYNRIQGNVIMGGGNLASSDGGAIEIYGLSHDNDVTENRISGFRGHGISVVSAGRSLSGSPLCARNNVIGNSIELCSWFGISLHGASETFVSSNVIRECSQERVGAYGGINITSWYASLGGAVSTATDNRIQGNVAYGTAQQRCGLTLNSTAPVPTGTVIQGNYFPMGNVYSIEIMSGVTATLEWNLPLPSVPSLPGSAGNVGEITWDADFFYVNTTSGWRRAALSTWP